MRPLLRLLPFLGLGILANTLFADIRYHLTEIPTFGGTWGQAFGLNNKGQVVGGASRSNGLHRAFVYDNGVMTDLGSLSGDNGNSLAIDINEQGQIAGQSEIAPGVAYAVRFDHDRILYIGALGAGARSWSTGINSHGAVIGAMQVIDPGGHWRTYHAFLFDGQNLRDLTADRVATESWAYGINDNNEVVGSYPIDSNHWVGFFYDGVVHEITMDGVLSSGAGGINNLSQVVGSIATQQNAAKPILYEHCNIHFLPPMGISSGLGAINNNGQMLGGYRTDLQQPEQAYISDGITNLDLTALVEPGTGFSDISGNRINDLGEIVGNGTINGQSRGFVLTPTQWKNDSNGLWSDPTNWLPNSIPDSLSANANFLSMTTSPRTITLDSPRSTRTLNFRNPNSYTLIATNNAPLTLGDSSNPAMINVIEGNHTIAAPLILAGSTILNITDTNTLTLSGSFSINSSATKWGDGTLNISGPQSHSPGASLRITAGQLILASNAGPNLSLSITSNPDSAPAIVTLNSDQDIKEVSVDVASPGLQALNLAGHSLAIFAADLPSAKASLNAALRNARTNSLDGIIDSTLASDSTIALLQFPDHLLLRQTLNGDLNLDGQVTIADFIQLASHFESSGLQISWSDGDLNYDNAVTIADFIDLASNFGSSYSGDILPIWPEDQQILSNFASAHGADSIPEPAALTLFAALLFCRRRH